MQKFLTTQPDISTTLGGVGVPTYHNAFSQSVSLIQYVVLSVCPPACLSLPVSFLSSYINIYHCWGVA